jgi:hypothetical protein
VDRLRLLEDDGRLRVLWALAPFRLRELVERLFEPVGLPDDLPDDLLLFDLVDPLLRAFVWAIRRSPCLL